MASMRRSRSLALCVALSSLSACGTETEAERLKDSCDARECPDPAPEYLDCMPVVSPDWAFACDDPCYSFFRDTCGIKYTF
jgi:hypothetical protein